MGQTHHEKRMKEIARSGFHDQVIDFYDRCICEMNRQVTILDLGAGNGMVSHSLAEKEYADAILAFDRDMESMGFAARPVGIVMKAGWAICPVLVIRWYPG